MATVYWVEFDRFSLTYVKISQSFLSLKKIIESPILSIQDLKDFIAPLHDESKKFTWFESLRGKKVPLLLVRNVGVLPAEGRIENLYPSASNLITSTVNLDGFEFVLFIEVYLRDQIKSLINEYNIKVGQEEASLVTFYSSCKKFIKKDTFLALNISFHSTLLVARRPDQLHLSVFSVGLSEVLSEAVKQKVASSMIDALDAAIDKPELLFSSIQRTFAPVEKKMSALAFDSVYLSGLAETLFLPYFYNRNFNPYLISDDPSVVRLASFPI